jgi:pimeloyl-ACP methyl ester carboxylesterase
MNNLRKYGTAPFNVALVHGGPGAAGEMSPVAEELSTAHGVLEPLQTQDTLAGQILELKEILSKTAELPVCLIGFSYGAMLSFIFTAKYHLFVKKLIMVGSAVFEEKYAQNIMTLRMNRLNDIERAQVYSLMKTLGDDTVKDKDQLFRAFGRLISKADSYDPLPYDDEGVEYRYQIYDSVWCTAEELRNSGKLLELGKQIHCPVLALHGDYDPHPVEGIKKPLTGVLKDFRFIVLKHCGHRPWLEREAREKFYKILKSELCE